MIVLKNLNSTSLRYLFVSAAISLLLVFFAQVFSTSYDLAVSFSKNSTKEWCFTALVIFLVCLCLDCLAGRKYISIPIVSCLLLLLSGISGQKYGYRSEPLYPWDFLSINQVIDLLPVLFKERPGASVIIAVVGLALIAFVICIIYKIYKCAKIKLRRRLGIGGASFVVLIFCLYSISPLGTTKLYNVTGIMNMAWDQSINYPKNGFLLAFSFSINSALIKKPKIEIESVLRDLENSVEEVELSKNKIDVIVVMNESFWDPTKLPGVSFSSDPMPTVRLLQKGEVFSPVYGGGTANVEFEALTGFSNAFLPTGSLPYQQYIARNTPSIIWALKNIGYRSVAVHPYHRWFWNRDLVYSKLGFDRFVSIDELPKNNNKGLFFSDEQLSREIIKIMDETDQPTFLFAVTMQNHGPYEKLRYPEKSIDVRTDIDIGKLNYEGLQTYTEGIHDADRGLNILVSELSNRARPTLLIFFGDHLPMMGQNFEVFKETGFVAGATTDFSSEQLKKIRTTPFVVWSNSLGDYKGEGLISPSLIPNVIDSAVGLNHPFYGRFLGSVRKNYSVIEQKILGRASGGLEENWHGTSEKTINQYQSIQYDLMFGKRLSSSILFPGFRPDCCGESKTDFANTK
ncbi:LTA synthase family protein [Pseudomonas sp. L1(2025)]|uniref:LTA synthase family protein n=1 Tax=Pseudomonas sp. L1(2025) TaxID=3449429 RepID=UPI003F690733